jgi:hypothetical protein
MADLLLIARLKLRFKLFKLFMPPRMCRLG